MNKKQDKLFFSVVMVMCVLLFCERLTGGVWHAVLGFALVVLLAGHVRKQQKKTMYRKVSIQMVDKILMAAFAAVILTGILLHPLQDMLILKILHKLSAVIFVVGIIVHMVQHSSKRKRRN